VYFEDLYGVIVVKVLVDLACWMIYECVYIYISYVIVMKDMTIIHENSYNA
jgi:hypothetical protein